MLENITSSVSEVDPVIAGVVCGIVLVGSTCYTFRNKIKNTFYGKKVKEVKSKKVKNKKVKEVKVV